MTAVRQGDLAALTPLFERHSRRLFGFLRGLSGSAGAAEDLVQESFLRVLRHRRRRRLLSRGDLERILERPGIREEVRTVLIRLEES